MELSSLQNKKFQEETSKLKKKKKKKKKKNHATKSSYIFSNEKLFLYFGKRNFLIFSQKFFCYISGNETLKRKRLKRELAKPENQKFQIICLLREDFSNICAKEKSFLYFLYKEAKFSKLKYFLIIVIKRFFSFYNICFYTQPVYFFTF